MANRYNPPTRINGVRTAPFGAIMAGLQLGKMVGDMMPDTNAGNTLKGVFDPMANVGAGIAYMSEGKIGKGLASLIPGIGTYMQGKDADAREAEIKAITDARAKASYVEAVRSASMNDLQNYTPTNNISMYPDGGVISDSTVRPNQYKVIKSRVPKLDEFGNPTGRFITRNDTVFLQDTGTWGENLQAKDIPQQFIVDSNGKLIVNPVTMSTPKMSNGGKINSKPVMVLSNNDITKFGSMKSMSDALEAGRKLGATDHDLMRIAKMKYWIDGQSVGVNIDPMNTNMKNLIYKDQTPTMPNGGRLNSPITPMGGRQDFSPVSGDPMTQGATTITTPAGSTAGRHETGQNVPVLNNNGQPVAIGEPGEVVVDDLIISKRNGLAQKYIAIDNQKQALLAKMDKAKTPEARAGLTRSITFYDKQLESIKAEQETLAQQPQQQQIPVAANGMYGLGDYQLQNQSNFGMFNPNKGLNATIEMPTMPYSTEAMNDKYGYQPEPYTLNTNSVDTPVKTEDINSFDWAGGIDKTTQIGAMILPSVMNYKNQKLMDESMKEIASHRPTLNKMNYIEPDYQVGDQVAGINNNFATMNAIAGKVSNPLTAGSILAGAGADRAQRLNEVFGAKNRADAETHYRQTMMGNQMNVQNTALLNQDSAMKLENRLSLNNAQITLNNTTADNLYTMLQEQNLKEKDRLTLTMAVKALNQYGVIDRKLADELKAMGIDISNIKTK